MTEKLSSEKNMIVMIGTPAYGGYISTDYNLSILNTIQELLINKRINIFVEYVEGCSLVMDARNKLVERFLKSDATHLLFIDSDMLFEPEDVYELISHADETRLVLAGLYPRKKPNWSMIHNLVKMGAPHTELGNHFGSISDSLFFPLDPPQLTNVPIRVKSCGAGFLLIARQVFEKLKEAYPEYTYYERKEDSADEFIERFAYFDTRIMDLSEKKQHVGEDISFCYLCKNIGIDIWMLPWVNIGHSGTITYRNKVNYRTQ